MPQAGGAPYAGAARSQSAQFGSNSDLRSVSARRLPLRATGSIAANVQPGRLRQTRCVSVEQLGRAVRGRRRQRCDSYARAVLGSGGVSRGLAVPGAVAARSLGLEILREPSNRRQQGTRAVVAGPLSLY